MELYANTCSPQVSLLISFSEYLFGIKTRSFGYNGQFKRRCLFIMNHVSHFDWMFSWGMIERQGDLLFWRAISKDAIKSLLFIGELMDINEQTVICICLLEEFV